MTTSACGWSGRGPAATSCATAPVVALERGSGRRSCGSRPRRRACPRARRPALRRPRAHRRRDLAREHRPGRGDGIGCAGPTAIGLRPATLGVRRRRLRHGADRRELGADTAVHRQPWVLLTHRRLGGRAAEIRVNLASSPPPEQWSGVVVPSPRVGRPHMGSRDSVRAHGRRVDEGRPRRAHPSPSSWPTPRRSCPRTTCCDGPADTAHTAERSGRSAVPGRHERRLRVRTETRSGCGVQVVTGVDVLPQA